MTSNRVTNKLFASLPQPAIHSYAFQPQKSPSPQPPQQQQPQQQPEIPNETKDVKASNEQKEEKEQPETMETKEQTEIKTTQSMTNSIENEDEIEFQADISLRQSLAKVEKHRHLEQVIYLSKPPQQGILIIYSQKSHVFLKFQPYINQMVQDSTIGPHVMEIKPDEGSVEFCIEDTPTYEMFDGSQDVQIQFVLGRKLTIEIHPFIMPRDTEYKLRMFLRNFGVTMKDGVIRCDKKRVQFEINVPSYLAELKNDKRRILMRENWKVTNGVYDIEIIDKSVEWNDETQNEIRKRLRLVGIENDYRIDMWMKCLEINLDRSIYEKIKIQVENLVDIQIKNNTALRRDIEQIAKDIKRTTINEYILTLWKKDADEIKDIMTFLLRMWIVFNMNSGYHQGMNEIILGLMESTTDEYQIFATFVKLMEMMSKLLHGKVPFDSIITPIMRTVDPDLESYFSMMKIGYSFMYKWVILLFRRDFSREHCIRLWDAIFACSEDKFHFFIAVAMLLQHRELILHNRLDLDDMSIFFLGLENKFDIDILFEAAMCLQTFKTKASEEDKNIVFN